MQRHGLDCFPIACRYLVGVGRGVVLLALPIACRYFVGVGRGVVLLALIAVDILLGLAEAWFCLLLSPVDI